MKRQIGPWQLTAVLVCSRVIVVLNFSLGADTSSFSTALCLGTLLAAGIISLLCIPNFILGCKMGMSPVDCAFAVSKPVGCITAVTYSLYFFIIGTLTLIRLDFFATSTMQTAENTLFFPLIMLVPVLYAVIKGIEPLSRFAGIFVFVAAFAILLIFALMIPRFNTLNIISPFFDGISEVARSTVLSVANSSELVIFAMLVPFANGVRPRHFIVFSVFSAVLVAMVIFTVVAVLGPFNSTQLFPYFTVSSISGGSIIERMASVQSGVWIILDLIKTAISIYLCGICLQRLIPSKYRKIMYAILVCASVVLCAVFSNFTSTLLTSENIEISLTLVLLFGTVLPTVLLIIYRIKKRCKKEKTPAEVLYEKM